MIRVNRHRCMSVQPSLLTTKLYFPPPRASLVPRPRLVERLQAGLCGPLTLISAPAGSGKSTILSQWRLGPGAGVPVAWLSLDPADNDPARFLQYISAALDPLSPGLAEEAQPLLQSVELPSWEEVLTIIINRLSSLEGETVLALDDFHLIENPVIHTALTFLLDHLPPHLHLVLLSRADPPLPLARLRARSQLIEIRGADLRFNVEESAQFLNQVMGLDLTGEQVAALERRAEGWIAGLQLAALSMQGRENLQGFVSAFTGSHHFIVDYLGEEVLERQPESLRQFLLKTSILERFTGPLCDALTDEGNGDEVLKRLDHANLFIIPLDDEQHWFRYHNLFADLLRNRLLHFHPELVSQLHIKASAWFEANGFRDEAISHALEAKDFGRAARLFCQDRLQVITTHSISTLDKWLQAFPEAFLCANPWLCIAKTHILWSIGRRDELVPYVSSAVNILDSMVKAGLISEEDPEYLILRGDTYSFQALIAGQQNDLDSALELAQKAVQIIPHTARNRVFALGSLYWIYQASGDIKQAVDTCLETIAAGRLLNYPSMQMTATYTLAQMLRVQGRLQRAAQVLREALEFAEGHGQARLSFSGILHIGLAETLYEWNAMDEMEAELETGLSLCRQGGMSILVVLGLLAQAQLRHARGDLPVALKILEKNERDWRAYQNASDSLRLRWQAEQGDLTGLADWISRVDLNVEQKIGTRRFDQLTEACRFLFALDRCKEASQVLEKVKGVVQAAGDSGWLISVLVLQSVVWGKKNNDACALDCLKQALALAEPEGYVRVFLNQGQSMQKLLHLLQKRGGGSEYVTCLLAAFEPRPKHKTEAALVTDALPEPLSGRELDVLKLLAQGCPDKQIAESLVIARETVHKHLKNIYGKLGVHSRTEAIARARELDLL